MLLLDTDALTLIQRAAGEQYESLADYLDAQETEVVVSVISFEEQMRGSTSFISKAKSAAAQVLPYQKLHALLIDFQTRPILDFDDNAAATFERLRKQRVRVGAMDMKIAAIAIANDVTLVTMNRKDFEKIPNLKLSDWRP